MHPGPRPWNELLQRGSVAKNVLPHFYLCRWETKGFCLHISEPGDLRVCQIDPFLDSVYLHFEISSLVDRFMVCFLTVDDNPQVFRDEGGDRNVPAGKAAGFLSCEPILMLEGNSDEDLGCRGKTSN